MVDAGDSDPMRVRLALLDDLGLPEGEVVNGRYWLSDERLDGAGELWSLIAGRFGETKLWPVLVDGSPFNDDWPWVDEPAFYTPTDDASIGAVDVRGLLNERWKAAWIPGRSPIGAELARATRSPGAPLETPGRTSETVPRRLLLVPVARPSDAVGAIGWEPFDMSSAEASAVVRSWEERFGAVLVALAPKSMVVRFPFDLATASVELAAELYAFAPDIMASESITLEVFAGSLRGDEVFLYWDN